MRSSSAKKISCNVNTNQITIAKETVQCNPTSFLMTNHVANYQNKTVLFPTAFALIKNKSEQLIRCRILLDSGSQKTFLTKRMVQLLKLPKQNIKQGEVATLTATVK